MDSTTQAATHKVATASKSLDAALGRVAQKSQKMWPIEAGAEALSLQEEIWPVTAMRLAGPFAARSPGLWLALALEIERHCSADEILQGRLIDLIAFVDVDGAPDIPVEAGVE